MGGRFGERAATFGAMATGFLVLVAHGLLETSRDALFLSHVPASHLPWMYLALAFGGLSVSELGVRARRRFDARWLLIASQAVAATGTIVIALFVGTSAEIAYYALYLWVGVASISVLVRYWQHLAGCFTATRAKRLFPLIGTGSIAGALVGYALAEALSQTVGIRATIPVAAAFFALSMLGPLLFFRADGEVGSDGEPSEPTEPVRLDETLRTIAGNPYLRRVAVVLVIASATVTIVDFVFKSVVADQVPAQELGSFFARAYFGFNVASLLLLLAAVNPIVQRFGVTTTLALLPIALLAGGVGMLASGGLIAAVALKSADGALRWSAYKTASELLYVPLANKLRNAVKGTMDLLSPRLGQALGSVVILVMLATTESLRVPVACVCVLAAVWIVLALALKQDYLDLFRATLSRGPSTSAIEFPELDVGSLEVLVAALNSPEDGKVLAAMDLLEQKGKGRLVPVLLLYHPAPSVVVGALDMFARAGRREILPLLPRLSDHEYAEVRAAALRAANALRPDEALLRQALEHHCPVVNVTALVGLTVGGWIPVREGVEQLLRHAETDSELARPMIARAINYRPLPAFAPVLVRLAADPDFETRRQAILAMRAANDVQFVPPLVRAIGERALREDARDALVAMGEPALSALEEALRDISTPIALRIHLPRTIARFQNQRAADVLLRQLTEEGSGLVRYKILRGLGRMVATDSTLRLDEEILDTAVEKTLQPLFERIHWQLVLESGVAERPERDTPGHELLLQLLRDKEELAIERLFRVLGLRYRSEDWAEMYDGVYSEDPVARSSGRELLESALPRDLGKAVVALIDDGPLEDRLAAGDAFYEPAELSYDELVDSLTAERGETLRLIARYHAVEIGLRADVDGLFRPVDDEPAWRSAVRSLAERMRRDLPDGGVDGEVPERA